jgi:hypothetical protein
MTDRSDAARSRAQFDALFDRTAARVRARLAWRLVMTCAAIGLAVGAVVASAAWWSGHAAVRAYAPLAAVAFAGAGLVVARRRRWSDEEVALYLDARLESSEAIASAVGLGDRAAPRGGRRERASRGAEHGARGAVVARAIAALAGGPAHAAQGRWKPAVWKPAQLVGPIAAIAAVLVARAPMPRARAASPGTADVHLDADGLARVAKLAEVAARDAAQRGRLDAIARDAERLREKLRAGMARREAQAEMARLKDALAAERLSLGAGEQRGGLESAVARLAATNETAGAARDLGDHDLAAMDREMERIANQRESSDRARAKTALAEAAAAARAAGAEEVARALEDDAAQMERRAARAETLRELARALQGAGAPNAESEALDREASDAAARKLARAMEDALGKLTPEERRRVAERLRDMARRGASSHDGETARDLADALSTAEGRKRLEAQLAEMAREGTEAEEAARDRALRDAERGAGETEEQLRGGGQGDPPGGGARPGAGGGAIPVPQAGSGAGAGGRGPGAARGALWRGRRRCRARSPR